MKTAFKLLLLFNVTSAYDYGLYAYYRFFGPTLYDLSGFGHHGFNGLAPGDDPNDSIQTDRGLFFDGVAGCATQHANYWTDPTPILTPIMILMWVWPLADGPILTRADTTQRLNMLEVKYVSATHEMVFTVALDNSYTRYTLTYSPPVATAWLFMGFYIATGNDITLKIFFETTEVAQLSTTADVYSEQPTNDLKTLFGVNAQNTFGHSILYVLAMDQTTTFDYGVFLTTTCGNQCYFGGDPNYCNCVSCHKKVGACTSTNLEPLQDGSGLACSSIGCSEGCDATSLCFTCDISKWPVCNTDNADYTTLCHADCASCLGPLATHCATCTDPLKEVDTSTGGCVCSAGYYWDGTACKLCHSDCATCTGPMTTDCLTCIDSLKTVSSIGCECVTGYYWDGSACQLCHSDCAACVGPSATDCIACSDSLQSIDLNSNLCVCLSGYFWDGLACQSCHSDCATCSQPDLCITCKVSGAVPDTLSGCECPSGQYSDGTNCVACNSQCSTCSTAHTCDTCIATNALPAASLGCVCAQGYYGDGSVCTSCHTDCLTCQETDLCLSCKVSGAIPDSIEGCVCPANAQDTGLGCECDDGYYLENEVCRACHLDCATCDRLDLCLTCVDPDKIPNNITGCECVSPFTSLDSKCVCPSGTHFVEDDCIQDSKVSIEAAEFDSFEEYLLALILVTGALAVFVAENPSTIWSLLNTIDLLAYTPLHDVGLPESLFVFFKEFDLTAYFLDISVFLFDSVELNETIPRKWQEYGFVTSNFLFNILQYLLLLGAMLALCFLLCFVSCLPLGSTVRAKCRSALKEFRFNVFLRLYIQVYLGLALASMLCFNDLYNSRCDYLTIIGVGVGTALFLTPLILGYLIYKREPRGEINHLSSLYYEFKPRKVNFSYGYYVYFFSRRLLFVVVLFYLGDFPVLQISVNVVTSLAHLILLWKLFRFAETVDHIQAIAVELGILALLGLLFCFLGDNEIKGVAEYGILGLAVLIIAVLYANLLVRTLVGLAKKCKNLFKKTEPPQHFTNVRVMRNYKIQPEEASDDSFELHRVNINLFTVRRNGLQDNGLVRTANESRQLKTYR